MNILTKVFVVLVAATSALLVGLVIAFTANTESYQAAIDAQNARMVTEAAAHRAEVDRLNTTIRTMETTLTDQRRTMSDQFDRLTRVNNERNELTRQLEGRAQEIAQLNVRLDRLETHNARLGELRDAAQQDARRAEEERNTAQAQIANLRRELLSSEADNTELRRQVRFMEENFAVTEGQMRALVSRIEKLPEPFRSQASGSAAMPEFDANPQIVGRVVRVDSERGQTFVQINVGRNDRVQQQMRFMIHRDGNFKGNVIISRVDEQTASGVVRLPSGDIRVGDAVYSGPANPS